MFDLLGLLLLCIKNVGATVSLWAVIAPCLSHTRTRIHMCIYTQLDTQATVKNDDLWQLHFTFVAVKNVRDLL